MYTLIVFLAGIHMGQEYVVIPNIKNICVKMTTDLRGRYDDLFVL